METNVLGYIHFDRPGSGNNQICDFLTRQDLLPKILRNKYVKISASKTFVGRIIEGPFFVPEEVSRDSALAQTVILKGDKFPVTPNYYSVARIEILGEFWNGMLFSTASRPEPKSEVRELNEEEVQQLIKIRGEMFLGQLQGYEKVQVVMDSNDKKVLPRNVGIFGTVGSGKTNTAQVLIEEATKLGYAVVVIDVEGEYVNMDKPSTELHEKLEKLDLKPEGVSKFKVFFPTGSDRARPDALEFDINFGDVDPYILTEILNLTEAQERVFFDIAEKLTKERRYTGEAVKKEDEQAGLFLLGEFEARPLKYTIWDFFKELSDESEYVTNYKGTKSPIWALRGRLGRIAKNRLFDRKIGSPRIHEILKPSQISVVDVSTASDDVKNITIAWILQKIFDIKLKEPDTPKTLIVIEEAHTFISRESVDRMRATMDMLKTIARRGRKRWLCLCFISQQPAHIPNEIFELCNTRVVHCTKSLFNINPLKETAGGVNEKIWDVLPTLGPGQAIVVSSQYDHPIIVDVRPSLCERKFVD